METAEGRAMQSPLPVRPCPEPCSVHVLTSWRRGAFPVLFRRVGAMSHRSAGSRAPNPPWTSPRSRAYARSPDAAPSSPLPTDRCPTERTEMRSPECPTPAALARRTSVRRQTVLLRIAFFHYHPHDDCRSRRDVRRRPAFRPLRLSLFSG